MNMTAMASAVTQANLSNGVALMVANLAKDTFEQNGMQMVQMLEQNRKSLELSAQPHIGAQFDVSI
jgi:hypothetical protein